MVGSEDSEKNKIWQVTFITLYNRRRDSDIIK